jgi:hypothetical protein
MRLSMQFASINNLNLMQYVILINNKFKGEGIAWRKTNCYSRRQKFGAFMNCQGFILHTYAGPHHVQAVLASKRVMIWGSS